MPPAQVPDFGARRSGGSGDLRHGNLTQILRYVRDHGASSRHDIARGCGLGISTMTDLIGELRSRRLVRELDPIRRPGAGRPTRPIAFDGEPWCVLGVHVNLDKVELRGEHRRRSRAVDRDRPGRPGDAGRGGLQPDRRAARAAGAHPGEPGADRARDRRRGSRLPPTDHGAAYNTFGWRDFDLGAAVTATLREVGIDQASVSVNNECQLAALVAARVELPLPTDAIAATWAAPGRSAAG